MQRDFVPDGQVCVRIIEVGVREVDIRDVEELERYLTESTDHSVARLFLIPQQSSWGPLVISYEALCKFFSCFAVHPTFIDVVRAFGRKVGSDNDSDAPMQTYGSRDTYSGISYLVKHAEENGRDKAPDPWSVRQMGVHHRTHSTGGDLFLIINPSRPLQQRLRSLSRPDGAKDAVSIHLMVLSSATIKWRWYIGHMERQYSSMKTKAQLSNIRESGERLSDLVDIHFDDTQDIQVLQDRFFQTQYHLSTNRTIMNQLVEMLEQPSPQTGRTKLFPKRSMYALIKEAEMQGLRVANILQRLDATLALVRAILDFRCLASSQSSNKIMAELARLSREDNALMMELTQKAARDTDILKALTLLGMMYLPAAFVTSLMGMDYIKVHNKDGFSIEFAGEFWIFLVLTVVFLLATFVGYYMWVRRKPRRGYLRTSHDWGKADLHAQCASPRTL